jgi:hypothetical protein
MVGFKMYFVTFTVSTFIFEKGFCMRLSSGLPLAML